MPRTPAWLALLALGAALASCGGHGSTRTAGAHQSSANRPAKPAQPGARPAPRARVPVLMYHVIDRAPSGAPSPGLWVPRSEFASEVATLAARGYHAVTLQRVWDAWHRGGRLPSKPVVFSFDDGYASQYTSALPILRSQGWSGVLNLEVATLHTTLRPWQVRRLIQAGWEVDAHTMTHPDLTRTYGAQLRYEVAGSRRWIQRHFGIPVNFFCYPAGRYDAHAIAAVRSAGYLAATTTNPGITSPSGPPYELPRVRVSPGDGAAGVLRELQGASGGAATGE